VPDGVVVIETRGSEGVVVVQDGREELIGAPTVEAVDTTGAGDCFNGVFAAELAEGLGASAAARRAAAAAALSVTKVGAREGMPTRDELDAFLRSR
jgi:ribokinase